jgi:hypothetical protein
MRRHLYLFLALAAVLAGTVAAGEDCQECACVQQPDPGPVPMPSDLDRRQPSGGNGGYQLVAFQVGPDKTKQFCVDVTVAGDPNDPDNPNHTVGAPTDGKARPTASVQVNRTANPPTYSIVVDRGKGVLDGCTNAVILPGAAPADLRVSRTALGLDGNGVVHLTGTFRFDVRDRFTVRFTCYRP